MKKILVVLGLAAATVAAPIGAQARSTHAAMSFKATLLGKAEVPAKGAPHGTGKATVNIDLAKGTLCYSISVSGITLPAVAAHIHAGKKGKAGPVLVTLNAPGKNGRSVGCARGVKASILKAIEGHPLSYYINVHTTDFPGGAVRGQV